MKLSIFAACVACAVVAAPVQAQFHPEAHRAYVNHWNAHPEHPENLVRLWHQHLFHNEIPAPLLNRWVGELRTGIAPLTALAHMFASPEYYLRVGSTPEGFIRNTFLEVVGRPPTPPEFQFWIQRLYVVDRVQVANEIVARYPPAWAVGAGLPAPVALAPPVVPVAPVELYEYRRPIVRYR